MTISKLGMNIQDI